MYPLFWGFCLVLLCGVWPGAAFAQSWTGVTTDWFDTGNWSSGQIPTTTTSATINTPANVAVIDGGSAATSYISVGSSNTGTLTVENAATFTVSGSGVIGSLAGSDGSATVTGSGSLWSGIGLDMGLNGTGSLVVSDGGEINLSSFLTIGRNTGSVGQTVIESGGVITSSYGEISYNGGQSNVLVTGSGSIWNPIDHLTMGGGATSVSTLTVADGGEVVTTNRISFSAGTNTLNIGAGALDAAAAPGTVSTNELIFNSGGTGTLVFNHTSDDYTFAPIMTGHGFVDVVAGTTVLTGDSHPFTGTTTIDDGAVLEVDSNLGGAVSMASGGMLQGVGTLGAFTLPSGATLAPGSLAAGGTPGALTISGAYTQSTGSTLQVAATPAAAGELVVNGAASLGGNLVLVPVSGAWHRGASYEILSATGGVSGTFDGVSNTHPAWATFDVSYAPDAVFITVNTAPDFFAGIARTTSQKSLAGRLDTLSSTVTGGAFNDTLNALYAAPTSQNLDTLNGYVMTGLVTGAATNMQAVLGNVATRLTSAGRYTLQGDFGPGNTVFLADADPAYWGPGNALRRDVTVWAQGLNNHAALRGTADALGQHSRTNGFAFGMERRPDHHTLLGATFGVASTGFTINATAQSGRQVSYVAGVYGARGLNNGYVADASAMASFNHATSRRDVALAGARANGQTDGYGVTLNAGISRPVDLGHHATFTPRFGLGYDYTYENGYTEQGAPGANLAFDSARQALLRSTLEATVAKTGYLSRNSGVLDKVKTSLTLGARHDWRPVRAVVNEQFAGVANSTFTVRSVTPGRDSLLTGVGVTLVPGDLQALKLYARYNGAFANHASDNTLTLGARFSW